MFSQPFWEKLSSIYDDQQVNSFVYTDVKRFSYIYTELPALALLSFLLDLSLGMQVLHGITINLKALGPIHSVYSPDSVLRWSHDERTDKTVIESTV